MRSIPCLIICLGAAAACRAERQEQVDVVVDMTPEGRKLPHPDSAHPAYYLPVLGGFKEMGALVKGEKQPSPHEVARLVAVALARQGYFVANPAPGVNARGAVTYADGTVVTVPVHYSTGTPLALNQPGNTPLTMAMLQAAEGPYSLSAAKGAGPGRPPSAAAEVMRTVDPVHGPILRKMPSLVLSIHWGYLNPDIFDPSEPTGTPDNPFFNENQMLALVGGNTLGNLSPWLETDEVMQAAKDDRYFVMLGAYDYESYQNARKKVLLWVARMSVPSNGLQFSDVMATLIQAGGPFLGRETLRPKMLLVPVTPEGKVTVGTPVPADYQDAPVSPAPPQPPTPAGK